MAAVVAKPQLPAITISLPSERELSVVIPGSDPRTWALAHHLVAEIYLSSISPHERVHPIAYVKAGKHGLCLQILTRTYDGKALVQRLEGAIVKYARDDAGVLTHRTIVTPYAADECKTCLGVGRIRDGETHELRKCLDCNGSGAR